MNNNANIKLPLTHYDRLKKSQGNMWDFIINDINILKSIGWTGAVNSVDDFQSNNFELCIEYFFDELIKGISQSTFIPFEEVRSIASADPKTQLILHGINHNYHNILNFELSGKKTFFFQDNLSEHLIATELNIDSELVKPPFDSSLFVYTSSTVIQAAFAFFKIDAEPVDYKYPISVFVTSLPDSDTETKIGRKILMGISHWRGAQCSFYLKREVAIRPNWKIDDSLKTDWQSLNKEMYKNGLKISIDGENRSTSDQEFYSNGLTLFRLILNSILYLSSNDADILERISGREVFIQRAELTKSALKAKKIRHEASKESALNYSSIGESITPIYVKKGASSSNNNSDTGFIEYAVRFLVRGHWRNQPCGPNLDDRKLVWIKPYYKGPEIGELINRPYVVK